MFDLWNYFSTWSLVVTVVLLYLYHWYKRPDNFPPGPRGIPFLGVLPLMGKNPEKVITNWSKKYGAVMSIRFGPSDVIVLNNFDVIQKAFVKQPTKFSGRPQMEVMNQFTEGYGLAMTDYGDAWKSQRKFGLVALRGFGVGKQSLESRIAEEAACFCDAVREENGKAFDINHLLHTAVSNIICSVGFGKRFDYDDQKFKEVLKLFVELTGDTFTNVFFMFTSFAPFLLKVPPFSTYNTKMKKEFEKPMTMLRGFIKDNEDTFDEHNLRNFIDAFILEMKRKTDGSFHYKQLCQYVRDLFEAGTTTTANTLYWMLLGLIHYPQVQERLRKEVESVIGMEGKVSFQKRLEMPYTCAFIEEIMRYRTLTPQGGIQHSTSEEAVLEGYVIPKGTMLMANIWAVHNDESIWDKPETFNPDRFLDEKGDFVRSPYVIPFSMGPRHCLGEQLARMELFIFLVSMLQRFKFSPGASAKDFPDFNDDSENGMIFVSKRFKLIATEL